MPRCAWAGAEIQLKMGSNSMKIETKMRATVMAITVLVRSRRIAKNMPLQKFCHLTLGGFSPPVFGRKRRLCQKQSTVPNDRRSWRRPLSVWPEWQQRGRIYAKTCRFKSCDTIRFGGAPAPADSAENEDRDKNSQQFPMIDGRHDDQCRFGPNGDKRSPTYAKTCRFNFCHHTLWGASQAITTINVGLAAMATLPSDAICAV